MFSLFTASSLIIRQASYTIRRSPRIELTKLEHPEWIDTSIGVGWTSLYFGKALSGRSWIAVFPAAFTVSAIIVSVERLLSRQSLWIESSATQKQHQDSWIVKRYKRIAVLEDELSVLNEQIRHLNERIKD